MGGVATPVVISGQGTQVRNPVVSQESGARETRNPGQLATMQSSLLHTQISMLLVSILGCCLAFG